MPTRNHPASVAEIDAALGVSPGSLLASKRVAAAEELFDAILSRPEALAPSGREDRVYTAFTQRLAVVAALARNRPAGEFERWIDTYFANRRPRPRCHR